MDLICGSTPLWDKNLSWNTTVPDLTDCFEKTVLVWVPCGFLWISTPYELWQQSRSKSRDIPWNTKNIMKCVSTVLLIILSAVIVAYNMAEYYALKTSYEDDRSSFVLSAISHMILMVTSSLALLLTVRGRHRGIRSSGPLFLFWLLLSVAMVIVFRSKILKVLHENVVQNPIPVYAASLTILPLVLLQFLVSCFADDAPQYEDVDYRLGKNVCPEESSSVLSQYVYWWLTPLLIRGYKSPLTMTDLWDLTPRHCCNKLIERFDLQWNKDRKPARRHIISMTLLLFKTFWLPLLTGTMLKLLSDILLLMNPQLLNLIIDFMSSKTEAQWKGLFYAVTLFISGELQSILLSRYFFHQFSVAMDVRSVVVSVIYKKALRLSNSERRSSTIGEIVNLMSIDAQRLLDVVPVMNMMWSAPLQITLALYFLWQILGPSALSGITFLLLLGPINAFAARKANKLQANNMKLKDQRTKLMNEIMNGIKILKLYAWEKPFLGKVLDVRQQEIGVLKRIAYLNASMIMTWTTAPFIVALVSFGTFVLTDENNILTPNKAFVSLALLNIIRYPLTMLPNMASLVVQAYVSMNRINKYMAAEEIDDYAVSHVEKSQDSNVIRISNGTFTWNSQDTTENNATLQDIQLNIKRGNLVAIVGHVGCGKTSLLSAILGEMTRKKGFVKVTGRISYVPQIAWIRNSTVSSNILMFNAYNKDNYEDVIDRSALRKDLYMLPGGDQTEIGENGINLSGGQKQRISLARAVYNDADVYLLDDPLSAVDSHVGKHIFKKVIGPKGILKDKTRIFVTHGLTFLPKCDFIVFMKNGKISKTGTYEDFTANQDEITEFVTNSNNDVTKRNMIDGDANYSPVTKCNSKMSRRKHLTSTSSTMSDVSQEISAMEFLKSGTTDMTRETSETSKLIQSETVDVGRVTYSVYNGYFRSIGYALTIFILFMRICGEGFSAGSNIWLSHWSTSYRNRTAIDSSQNSNLGVYAGIGLWQAFFVMWATMGLAYGTMKSATSLHERLLDSVIKSPMSFFDTTPIGRIINRFSKDVNIMDINLVWNFNDLLGASLQISATIIVVSMQTPLFLVVMIPLLVIYVIIQRIYVSSSRQLRRLESVTRSPIFVQFSETLTGISSIRAYGLQSQFIKDSNDKVDLNQICYFPTIMANRWVSVRLEFIGNCIILFAALFAVFEKGNIDAGSVGLSVSYAMSITSELMWMVRQSSELEMNMVCVERILEYTKLPSEAAWEISENKPEISWPKDGLVELSSYSLKYRVGLDLVLRNVNCRINAGEKVGICGRTGAGKSSLTLGLFRILEASDGSIVIDGVNISQIGLHDLRSKLTIIPQDPVLFSGSLRFNIDPFFSFSDDQVWNALEHVHLKSFVLNLSERLLYEIAEGGENLSVGQKQLICLARALLRKTKVLVLDEATAAIDVQTDNLIQDTIRKVFKGCTTLTIAHRLNTIMDSTRIIVLDNGRLIEFDSPSNLLKNSDSVFYKMAKDAFLI